MHNYIAVDLGAESGRVCVVTLTDGGFALREIHRFANGGVAVGQSLHWDVLHLWAEIKGGLRMAADQVGAIRSVAVDTWGIDFALLDRAGKLVGNPYCYRDARTTGMMERALARLPRQEIYRQSGGIQFLSINTLYQLSAMVEQRDPALDVAATFLMMPDLFHYWLSGRKACEFTNATTTQFYQAPQGNWAVDLLTALQIPPHLFPEVVIPGTVLGELSAPVAEETGLGSTPIIATATHDTAAAIVAVPAPTEQFAWLSSGTWSLLGGIAATPLVSEQALAYNFSSYGGPGGYFLPWKNIMGLWLLQECRRCWAQAGQHFSYETLVAMAEAAPPFTAILDPDDAAFLAPKNMLEAIAAYCRHHGQPVPDSPGVMTRVILESLVLRYRWTLEKLGELQQRTFDQLYVVGGGSRNQLLCQLTADACGVPVVAGPVEATAIGNAALQAVTLGDLPSLAAARALIRDAFAVTVYEPTVTAHSRAAWDEAYRRFQQQLILPA